MKLYRIVKTEYVTTAWSGYGAQQFGGRWNHPGNPVIYTSQNISLAILEILVHLQKSQFLANYSLLSIDIPDPQIKILSQSKLPSDWNSFPAPDSTMTMGDNWITQQECVGLLVPSVIVPKENNVILNPIYPEFIQYYSTIKIEDSYFDKRLLKFVG